MINFHFRGHYSEEEVVHKNIDPTFKIGDQILKNGNMYEVKTVYYNIEDNDWTVIAEKL